MKTRKVICIIGMHRSGTSMVANLLQQYGLNLGPDEKLLGSNDSNPKGHFEHTGFFEINEGLLKHLGGSWDQPPDIRPGWEEDPTLAPFYCQAKSLVHDFTSSDLWGWKEPRTTILLPFWKSIIPDLRFVFCVRSPLEVARSLEKRNGMAIEKAFNLWARYMHGAMQDIEGCAFFVTFYGDYFNQRELETIRLLNFCGLAQPDDLSSIQTVIEREFRHHSTKSIELLTDPYMPLEDKLLYLALRVSCFDARELQKSESECTVNIRALVDASRKWRDRDRISELRNLVAEKSQQLVDLHAALRERDQEIRRLQMFSDSVRTAWPYRFYKAVIRPLRPKSAR